MAQCKHCLLDLSTHAPLDAGLCPNCGKAIDPMDKEPAALLPNKPDEKNNKGFFDRGLIGQFFHTLQEIIFRPAKFFATNAQEMLSREKLYSALTFAVIVQWLAAFFNFVWRSAAGVLVESRMADLFRVAGDVVQMQDAATESIDSLRSKAVEFLFGAGAIILTPFTTVLKLVVTAALVHVAVRFFIKESADRPQSYATTLKILAYSSGAWILCLIPGLGVLLAWVLVFVASVAGIREVYRTSSARAVLAVTFPELLVMGFFAAALFFFLFFAFNLMRLVF